jgi:hypothetical protein
MTAEKSLGLDAVDPRVGQTLRFDAREWEVTDRSSYWNDEGYRVVEWCCETDDTEAYLLKEVKEGEPTRWFFTRTIDSAAVTLPSGEALHPWIDAHRGASPPEGVGYQGGAYRYAETNEGTYEDEPGVRVHKTTWDYWDAGRARNLAVELWEGGRVACYHGAYIDPRQVTLTSEASAAVPAGAASVVPAAFRATRLSADVPGPSTKRPTFRLNPFVTAAVVFPLAYLLPFFIGRPFDEGLAVALSLAGLGGWLVSLFRVPAAGGLALLGFPVLAVLFWHFAPLTSAVGLVALLAASAVVAWAGRSSAERGKPPVVYAAAFAVAGPAVVVGLYHYFVFAPIPHGLGELVLALGPALLGGLGAALVASVILSSAEGR